MERFRKYMGKDINLENIKNSNRLSAFGITCTYLPDPPCEFDEFEFSTDFNGQDNIVITIAIELGKIQRIMFSVADKRDPEVTRSLTESQVAELLLKKGDQLVEFFAYITQ